MNLKNILALTAVAMVFHTIEEYVTKLWDFDPIFIWLVRQFQINPIVIYFMLQALGLLLIFALWWPRLNKQLYRFLAIVLGLVFLLELSHLYSSIKIGDYYPGLYTGIALIIIGYFYWKELIIQYRKK